MVMNMWKNSLKNVESDNNKILYETLLSFFLQRNGTYCLNKPRRTLQTCFPNADFWSCNWCHKHYHCWNNLRICYHRQVCNYWYKSCSEKFANVSKYCTCAIFLSSVMILKIMGLRCHLMAYCPLQILWKSVPCFKRWDRHTMMAWWSCEPSFVHNFFPYGRKVEQILAQRTAVRDIL